MSNNSHNPEPAWAWKGQNGTLEFRYYNSLSREEERRLKSRPENNFRTTDDNYSYWVKICDDGNIILYRSPIIAYITSAKPSNSQQQVVLSAYDIDLIRQIAVGIPLDDILRGEISGLFKRIEERGLVSGSKKEGKIVTGQ